MDARIDIDAVKRTGQAIAFHWGALVAEIVGVGAVLAAFALATGDVPDLPGRTLTASYVIWTLRVLRLLAQVLVIVFLTRLIGVRDEFADARLVYIVLIIAAAVSFVLDGIVASGNGAIALEAMYTNFATSLLFSSLVVLDLVAKPVLLALGNRTILHGCASVLDSFGLYELAKKTRRAGSRFTLASVLLAFACLGVALALVLALPGGNALFDDLAFGATFALALGLGQWAVLLALVACVAIAYLVLWAWSARGIGRTYEALRELSS